MLSSLGGRQAIKETPSCSWPAEYIPGLPTAKPQSWVRENGLNRMTSLSEATPASQHGTNSNADQFWFGSAICSTLPKQQMSPPKPGQASLRVTSSTPAIANYTNCSFQHAPLSPKLYEMTPRKLVRPLQYLTFNGPENWQAASPHSNPKITCEQ